MIMESTTTITKESINNFKSWLHSEERSAGTIAKYMRDLERLSTWLGDKEITKENLTEWKEHLTANGYEPVTVNSMLAVVNTYCRFAGLNIKVKFLRIQRKLFREESKELNKDEYEKLIRTAEGKGNARLAMLIETMVRQVSGDLRYSTSRSKRRKRDGRKFPSKARYGTFCCLVNSAKSSSNMPKNKKSLPARFSSPKAAEVCPENRYGQR